MMMRENIMLLMWKMMEKYEEVDCEVILVEKYIIGMSLFLKVKERKLIGKNIVMKSVVKRGDDIGFLLV